MQQLNEQAARNARKVIGRLTGLRVESVSWINRTTNLTFAALVVYDQEQYMRALDWLTDPRNPFIVVKETPTRIFIAAKEA